MTEAPSSLATFAAFMDAVVADTECRHRRATSSRPIAAGGFVTVRHAWAEAEGDVTNDHALHRYRDANRRELSVVDVVDPEACLWPMLRAARLAGSVEVAHDLEGAVGIIRFADAIVGASASPEDGVPPGMASLHPVTMRVWDGPLTIERLAEARGAPVIDKRHVFDVPAAVARGTLADFRQVMEDVVATSAEVPEAATALVVTPDARSALSEVCGGLAAWTVPPSINYHGRSGRRVPGSSRDQALFAAILEWYRPIGHRMWANNASPRWPTQSDEVVIEPTYVRVALGEAASATLRFAGKLGRERGREEATRRLRDWVGVSESRDEAT